MSPGDQPDVVTPEGVRAVLREVLDPEIGVNVVDLGLVYGISIEGDSVRIEMTMTSPACPLTESIAREAEERLRSVAGVARVTVELVWDPPWGPERMSAAARAELGWPD